MDSSDLTRSQALAISGKIEPMRQYLLRLDKRIKQRCFPADDPLRVLVADALNAIHLLHNEADCRSRDGKGYVEELPQTDLLFTRTSKPRKHETRLGREQGGQR